MIDRLKAILRDKGLSPSQFADKLGVQRSGISHILNGRNKPSVDFLEKLLDAFPDIDANWLLGGKPVKGIRDSQPEITTGGSSPFSLNIETGSKSSEVEKAGNAGDKQGYGRLSEKTTKKIKSIVVLYQDNSFDEYHPIN